MPDAGYRVCIAGTAAWTPVGRTAESSAAAVRAGISRIAEHPYMVDRASKPMVVAMEPELEGTTGLERVKALAAGVVAQLGNLWPKLGPEPTVHLALPSRLGHDAPGLATTIRVAANSAAKVIPVPAGHAAGLLALEQLTREISARRLDAGVVLGVDSHIDPDLLEALDEEGELMSQDNRFGFPPGEGAGAVVVTSPSFSRAHGLPRLGTVVGVGSAQEPHHRHTDGVNTGEGLARAIDGATARLRIPDDLVARTYCDLNGQRFRSAEFSWAAQRVRPVFEDISDFVAPADCWGDVGAATGPLLLGLAVAAGQRGYARGPRVLAWTCSEGAERAAAVLELPGKPDRRG